MFVMKERQVFSNIWEFLLYIFVLVLCKSYTGSRLEK